MSIPMELLSLVSHNDRQATLFGECFGSTVRCRTKRRSRENIAAIELDAGSSNFVQG
jgi:hypothetical protein